MPVEVTMFQPESWVVGSKPHSDISRIWNQNGILTRWCFVPLATFWNTLSGDFLSRHRIRENSHVHYIKLVSVKVEWVCQRIVDVDENELHNRPKLHLQTVNARAQLGVLNPFLIVFVRHVTEN